MKKIFLSLVIAAAVVIPAASNAAFYQYVDTSGNLQTLDAESLADAEARAVSKAANSGFLIVSAPTPVVSSTTPSAAAMTESERLALISTLEAQISALRVQIEQLTKEKLTGGIKGGMATEKKISTKKSSSLTPAEKSERKEQKEKLKKERGVAVAQASIYHEDDEVRVSLIDYLEGEDVSIVATDEDANDVASSDDDESCEGRIDGQDVKTCKREVSFPLKVADEGDQPKLQIKVVVDGEQKQFTITAGGRGTDFRW